MIEIEVFSPKGKSLGKERVRAKTLLGSKMYLHLSILLSKVQRRGCTYDADTTQATDIELFFLRHVECMMEAEAQNSVLGLLRSRRR